MKPEELQELIADAAIEAARSIVDDAMKAALAPVTDALKHAAGTISKLEGRLGALEKTGIELRAESEKRASDTKHAMEVLGLTVDRQIDEVKHHAEDTDSENVNHFQALWRKHEERGDVIDGILDESLKTQDVITSIAKSVDEHETKLLVQEKLYAKRLRELDGDIAELEESIGDRVIDAAKSHHDQLSESLSAELRVRMQEIADQQDEKIAQQSDAVGRLVADADRFPEQMREAIAEQVAKLEAPAGPQGPQGEPGVPGQNGVLAAVKAWKAGVHHKNTVVAHAGGLWQAAYHTHREPGYENDDVWIPLVRGINHIAREADDMIVFMSDGSKYELGRVKGEKGEPPKFRGTYDADEIYAKADIVILRGTSYAALSDGPGTCPGENWQMVAQAKAGPTGKPGKQGPRGMMGPKGEQGQAGADGISISWGDVFELGMECEPMKLYRHDGHIWTPRKQTTQTPRSDTAEWLLVL